jgi:hypothetical protein
VNALLLEREVDLPIATVSRLVAMGRLMHSAETWTL